MKITSALKLFAVLVSCSVSLSAARAANISLLANDVNGPTTSLNGAGQWSNAAVPSSANDYFTATFFMRTPADGNSSSYTFAGHSLTLQTPSAANVRSIIFKGGGGNVYTINNLTNNGGLINGGSGNVTAPTFTGNFMYLAGNSTIQADQGSFNIGYPLVGSFDLTNTSGQGRTITYTSTSTNSAFKGRLVINSSVTVAFNSPANAPGNPSVFTPDQISVGAGCALQDNGGFVLTNANSGVTLGGAITISTPNAGTNTVIGVPITDNGGGFSINKTGGGTLTLSGNNTFSGGLIANGATAGATLRLGHPGALGTGTFTINSGNNLSLDNSSGAALTLANNNAQAWNNNFTFIGSQSLDMGAGTVTIGGGRTITVSSNTLTVGTVTDNGLYYPLIKSGPGKLVLNGGGNYYGSTVISNGVLALAGLGVPLYSTNITVATNTTFDVTAVGGFTMSGSQTLTGGGTVKGALTDNSSTIILPGGSGVAGTLTFDGLTLGGVGGSDSVNLDVTNNTAIGGGTNDLLVVNGDLTLNGGTVINVSFLNGTPNPGTYTIMKYTGTLTGDPATALTPPSLGSRYAVTFSASSGSVLMTITGSPQPLVWTGVNGSSWDTTTLNWTNLVSVAADYFSQGDSVKFDDTGVNTSISLSSVYSPGAVTVSNSSASYMFSGGGLSGLMSLTKTGNGTLILDEANSYTGPTTISGGTLQVGNYDSGASLGSGVVTNNANLVFASSAITMPVVNGTGTVSVLTGTVAAPNASAYTGNTYLNGGIALLQNSAGFGATNGSITVNSGSQLYMVANVDVGPKPLFLAGTGPDGNGAIRKGFAGPTTFYGPVTLTDDTLLNVDGGATLTLTNADGIIVSNVNNSLTNANLTLAGGGSGNIVGPLSLGIGNLTVNGSTWTVAPSNSFSGLTTINGGTLRVSGPLSLGPVPAVLNSSAVTLSGGALGASTNVTLNDGKIGISVNANSSLSVPSGVTLTISNPITGSANLTKTGAGTVVLNGSNPFSGFLYTDTFINYLNGTDGMLVIASTAALSGMPAVLGTPSIFQNNNTAAASTLGIDGTAGSVTIAPDLFIRGRGVAVANIENLAGNNTISGGITFSTGGALYMQSDSGTLTFVQPLPYAGDAVIGTPRSLTFTGNGNMALPGGLQNANGFAVNVTKSGTGTLILNGTNSSTGSTTVSGGLLVGTGTILGPVTVQPGGAIEAGATNVIGTFIISNSLTLGGNTRVKINQNAGTSDRFAGLTNVVYGGTLTVTNLAGTLVLGNSFTLFSTVTNSGYFTSIAGSPGAGLAYSFTNGVLSVVTGVASNPTNLSFTVTGSTLALSWPADHLGWILQSQTNTLGAGLTTNWFDLPGTAGVISTNLTLDPGKPAVFFRLRHP